MLASRYLRHIFDILHAGAAVPLSFAVFLHSECMVDRKASVSINDVYSLEPRLREGMEFVSRVECLPEGGHCYFSERIGAPTTSMSSSLFVMLQNSLGKAQFPLSDHSAAEILGSMKSEQSVANKPTLGSPLAYGTDMNISNDHNFLAQNSYLQPTSSLPHSPMPHQPPVAASFGTIGRSATAPNSFGTQHSSPGGARRTGGRRGRLFDLVDDGEEDNINDVVSGMLGTLNVDLFQNSGVQDVDIEAISLMGIGGSTAPNALQPRSTSRDHFR
jgi:hypothetical protein